MRGRRLVAGRAHALEARALLLDRGAEIVEAAREVARPALLAMLYTQWEEGTRSLSSPVSLKRPTIVKL